VKKRIQFFGQGEHSDCGLAVVAMIINYCKKACSLEQLRNIYGTPKGGYNMFNLLTILSAYGIKSKGVAIRDSSALKKLSVPSILFWQNNHFVILEKYSFGKFHILDPAFGKRTVNNTEFAKSFSNFALLLDETLTSRNRSSEEFKKKYNIIIKFIMKNKIKIIAVLLVMLFIQGISLLVPIFTRQIVDGSLQNGASLPSVYFMPIIIISTIVFSYGFRATSSLIITKLQIIFNKKFFQEFMNTILKQPFSYFANRSSGDLTFRANLTTAIQQLFTTQLLSNTMSFIFLVVYFGLMISYSVVLTCVTIAVCLLSLFLSLIYHKENKKITINEYFSQSEVQKTFVEIFSGVETIKALNIEKHFYMHWQTLLEEQLSFQKVRGRLVAFILELSNVLIFFLPIIIIYFGIIQVHFSAVSIGTVVAFISLSNSFAAPFTSIVNSIAQFSTIRVYADKLLDVINNEYAAHSRGSLIDSTSDIVMNDVTFYYSEFDEPVVEGVNIAIKRGERIVIVGASGSGKSTLLKLLSNSLLPKCGNVLVKEDLRNSISYINQFPTIFNDTLRNNLSLYNEDIDDKQILEILQQVDTDNLITNAKLGLDTVLSENGMNLSGGQKQKIAIARALLTNSKVILMDEPTSSMDNILERRILEVIKRKCETVVISAHRLSTIKDFDRIIVLSSGRVVEEGTHEELMKLGGYYTKLYSVEV
jgi:ABC-type bacteriocin/lantibiotic exporter with double-glycine peptidase domain